MPDVSKINQTGKPLVANWSQAVSIRVKIYDSVGGEFVTLSLVLTMGYLVMFAGLMMLGELFTFYAL